MGLIAYLKQLRGKPRPPFEPSWRYSATGDMVEAYFEDADSYAVNLTPDIVVMRAFANDRIVGVKLFGVQMTVFVAGMQSLDIETQAQIMAATEVFAKHFLKPKTDPVPVAVCLDPEDGEADVSDR